MTHLHPSALAAPLFFGLATLAFTTALSGNNQAHADDVVCSVPIEVLELEFSPEEGSDGLLAQELHLTTAKLSQGRHGYRFNLTSTQDHLSFNLKEPRDVEVVGTSSQPLSSTAGGH